MGSNNLEKLTRNHRVIAILCNQFGDTGKGKIVDLFASHWADITARGTGGDNAGHTVIINGEEKIFHLLPAGITYDSDGKITILGQGMVINPEVLCRELEELEQEGMTYNNLMISKDAHVIMSYHIVRDREENERGNIGTTKRGVGPCYEDRTARRGITIGDLYDQLRLSSKIEDASKYYPEQEIDPKAIIDNLKTFSEKLRPYIRNTTIEIRRFMDQRKRILIEGAQGLLLSIDHGTYPCVTSSDPSVIGTMGGVGLSAKYDLDICFGLLKYPFMTRVGNGPFPTELGTESETYCKAELENGMPKHDIFYEVKENLGMELDLDEIRKLQSEKSPEAIETLKQRKKDVHEYINSNREKVLELCNSRDPFIQGVGIRIAAREYGASTERPRRIGWTDLVAAKHAVRVNGPYLILTKPDCLEGMNNFSICTGYEHFRGDRKQLTTDFDRDEKFLRTASPQYKERSGYGALSDMREFGELPHHFQASISELEEFVSGKVVMVSVGQEQDQIIFRDTN